MSHIDAMLAHNKLFVENKQYEPYRATKYPQKKTAILTCMDTRLTTLLPAALGIQNGDCVLIKTAGALVAGPFDGAVRSLLVAIYTLGVDTVLVIGHRDCGMCGLDPAALVALMKARLPAERLEAMQDNGVDMAHWLAGFDDVEASVRGTVRLLRNHPLIPADVTVEGFVIDPETGALSRVELD